MRTTTTRAAAVSAATLILCLTGAGVAAAATVPDPTTQPVALTSVPPPGDILKLVKNTATSTVDKVTTIAGVPKKTPTSAPAREPAGARPALHLPSRPAHPARVVAAGSLASWSLPAGARLSDVLPNLPTGLAGIAGEV